ncbi:MAG TPA: leucine--tRNA ligase [Anaerolineales bacterium]|nr:leucine--tRNA ligase [Anaerolineales bacterium]
MTEAYNFKTIEEKWQTRWDADGLYNADIDLTKPKHYALTMLPYPSGDLHIGHWYAMTPSDARARFMRMKGYNVLFPMGFDSFGLPAENAAIKSGIHPKIRTMDNIIKMRKQLRSMGGMFDWRREIVSCEPEYYRWTEWFFIQLYKNGLAYRKLSPVDFCPNCNTTLAREQVWGDDRHCERCGTPVIKKDLSQWFFKSTQYADELLNFDGTDWPERLKTLQTNWIDRSEGASVTFHTEQGDPIEIFTTRPDTLWGATFMVISPEHPLVEKITLPEFTAQVKDYQLLASRQTEIQRGAADKEKTGIFTGSYAINPVNQARIPIWISDYVLMTYGTGAIMAVPAHDERDFAFARKFGIEIIPTIGQDDSSKNNPDSWTDAFIGEGKMINSGQFDGTPVNKEKGRKNPSITAVIDYLEASGKGKETVNYRYRDWLISRQRYWGSPIPMIECPKCGWNPVPEDQLPVILPEDVEWKPTGESPLKLHPTWSKTTCPVCGGPANRETDTMDTFMCSSWYQYRYLSPHFDSGPFDQEQYDYWMPVDTYTGGIEHATMHLLYTRFFHKAFRDIGITKGKEPWVQIRNQGMVLGEDNEKMSKSRGNVIAPDLLVQKYGADTVRAYLMFFARWELGAPWDSHGIEGSARWIRRTWLLFTERDGKNSADEQTLRQLKRKTHQTLARVTRNFENFEFNTIISALMEMLNEMYKAKDAGASGSEEWQEAKDYYVKMIAPIAPHMAEELWALRGGKYSIHNQAWPQLDEEAAKEDEITLPIQVNGKIKDRLVVPAGTSDDEIRTRALELPGIVAILKGTPPKKLIIVPGKLISIVI